jgi:hypothetical protein
MCSRKNTTGKHGDFLSALFFLSVLARMIKNGAFSISDLRFQISDLKRQFDPEIQCNANYPRPHGTIPVFGPGRPAPRAR